MRLATVRHGGRAVVAAVREQDILLLSQAGRGWPLAMQELAAAPQLLDEIASWAAGAGDGLLLADAELLAPVPLPPAIFTIGENYRRAGAAPGGRREAPLVFAKLPSSVIGPDEEVAWDASVHPRLDYEAELAVVIGRAARNVAESEAMEHVFGYTCLNDMASRDARFDGDQWLLAKSGDGFCPLGPWIVTADEGRFDDVPIRCSVSGELLQDGRTSQMIFSVGEVIAALSRHATLLPGTVIATGTPDGVGESRNPPRFLRDSETVTVSVEGIGELTTRIRAVSLPG
jgi:2-keto-4-pentenoate hydratase/2-oxohepta-3-ene-1,7-dioic acid hydratase in catechol pathway